ncbi:TonB-dependent receptor [Croceivirga thetidis]|uniref:TonB-dependent receptor n=1 Tax=Croceivirga thetidis TaxID=2721623 RepID=A0ABX1GQI6_9FLAO|nr:TonB-dependent receptor [Croceivirga thetidis]NKI32197.1 TonB-dependent receptor [Croceivirga thetidis]
MRFIIATMLFCHHLMGFTQVCEASLTGNVIDFHDRSPLARATITVIGQEATVVSNEDGSYSFEGLCPGNFELEVSHPECSTLFIPISINGKTKLDIRLEHHLEELNEVQVVGDVVPSETNSAQELVLDTQTIERFSAATLGDALRELVGVSSFNTGANIVKPTIHGLTGSRVLVLNDGVRMQDMEWGDEHAPNVSINGAQSVSVVKGASALKYGGDAIGGVILIDKGQPIKSDTLFGKTLINGVSNGRGGGITSELTKSYHKGWFINGQASYRRLGDQEAPDYILSNTGTQELSTTLAFGKRTFEWGWDATYSFYEADIAILRASHIGSVDDLIRSINSGQPLIIRDFTYDLQNPKQEVRHHLGKLNLYKRFEGLGKWNVQYDFQNNRRFEFDVRRGDRDDVPAIDLELTTHTLSTDFIWDANNNININVGLLGRYQDNFANPDTGVRRLIPDYDRFELGSFAIAEYHLGENWIFDAGVRYDFTQIDAKKFYRTSRWEERGYDTEFEDLIIDDLGTQLLTNPVFKYNNISGTIGGNFSKSNFDSFKFNYAIAQRAPNPSELFSDGLHHSAARIELGDLRIKSETSHKISLSKKNDFEKWGFQLEPYANFISDFILLEPTDVEFTIRGAFPVWSYVQTDVRLLGLDASFYSNWTTNLKSQHQFSIVKGKDTGRDAALINVPAANIRNSLTFSKPDWKGFELDIRSNYVFMQNEVPPNIFVFSPQQNEEVEIAVNSAPAAYHLLGMDLRSQFRFGKVTFTPSLTINNILNTTYRDYLNRQRYFADDLGRNFILQLKFNY